MSNSNKTNTSIQLKIPSPDRLSRYGGIAIIVLAIGFIGITFLNSTSQPEDSSPAASDTPIPTLVVTNPNPTLIPYEELTQPLTRSLVFIESTPRDSFSPRNGTGVIITVGGLILTNAHVINFGDIRGNVNVYRAINNRLIRQQATVMGIAPCEDLALLDIEGNHHTPIPMNITPTIGLGTEIFILGYGQSTLTRDLNNNISPGFARGEISRALVTFSPYKGLIEHTAELLPSDSGSPLFNRFGEMIGMNTSMDVQGRGRRTYAINQERIQLALAYLQKRQAPPINYTLSDEPDNTLYRFNDYFDRHCYTLSVSAGDIMISAKPQEPHLFTPVLSVYDSKNHMMTPHIELRPQNNHAQIVTIPVQGVYTVVISRTTMTTTGADKLGDYVLTISR